MTATPHVNGIDHLSDTEIAAIMARAHEYAAAIENDRHYQSDQWASKRIINLFFENSTRTRVSFDMAAQRLGAQAINIDIATSSVKKGESLTDTIDTLCAITLPDAIVMRHSEYGAPEFIANHLRGKNNCAVINAGDSWREHPTQAFLDALTIARVTGRADSNLAGLRIAICGDIAHSRVARSNVQLLSRLGADLRVVAPPALMPEKLPAANVAMFDNLQDGIEGCDFVMMLRLQKERMEAGLIGNDDDYFRQFGLTHERLRAAKPDAYVMHPGPMNRGVEIDGALADDPQRSLILRQVFYGVPARMAVFDHALARTINA